MPNHELHVDKIFRALGDPTRMAVVERLVNGRASASELARPFDMALPSFTQHLGILEASGLVTSEKLGRTRVYELKRQRLLEANDWLDAQRRIWTQRLDQLDAFLIANKDETP